MGTARARVVAVCAAAACVAGGLAGTVTASAGDPRPTVAPAGGSVPADLPENMPPAAYRAEPALPVAKGWPAVDAFPRTSGTGRLTDGAFYWTDFLYDDHGAIGGRNTQTVEVGSPSNGSYTYPDGPAHDNGADVFRAAVALRGDATYWRVDWNTLADPAVPRAVWSMTEAAGAQSWQLEVTAAGAELLPFVGNGSGGRLPGRPRALPVAVDRAARSFVVRIPQTVLKPSGTWRLGLAAGLASGAPQGSLPGQLPYFNLAFRGYDEEPATGYNFWNDNGQATALTAGDLWAFTKPVRWNDLAKRVTTPELQPKGWTSRWYVSSVELGHGRVTDPGSISDYQPNYLGRVQPYSVYVPQSYDGRRAAPLTWLLHSLTQNHNQYASTTPKLTEQACEQRRSICVTTLGRGPDGFYYGTAQLDFWEVWNRVAAGYRLDPERTVIAGYSMGGYGTNQIATYHPDLFAKAVVLAGASGAVAPLANLREVPMYLSGGAADELVPVTRVREQAEALSRLGYRYRWLVHATDHVAYELQDGFSDAAAWMGDARRERHPQRVTFTWTPRDVAPARGLPATTQLLAVTERPDLGVTTTGAYWVRGVAARDRSKDATISAVSGARGERAVAATRTTGLDLPGDPGPAYVQELTWETRTAQPQGTVLALELTNVRALTLRLRDAGFATGQRGVLDVRSDGPVTITVGSRVVRLAGGHSRVPFIG